MEAKTYKYEATAGYVTELFVYEICGGFATYYRKPNGSLKRVRSIYLPVRSTQEEAQADLDKWAPGRARNEVTK